MGAQSDVSLGTLPAETATPRAATAEPKERSLDIVGQRNWFFGLSLLIIIPGIISMVTRGFLLGIDFQGGTEFFLKFTSAPSVAAVQSAANSVGFGTPTVQPAGGGHYIIRTQPLQPGQQKEFEQRVAQDLHTGVDQSGSQVNEVGPTVAREIVTGALVSVAAASILILGYLAFRFRRVPGGWRSGLAFGTCALLALLHDVFVVTGVFSILGKVLGLRIGEIDSLFLTAVLTVVGFSVHDTIVVFDRIRENLIQSQRLTFEQVVNLSIMQSAARSIITSFTVVLVLLSLLVFGGDTLKGFVLALLIGIVSGTYSSIFNASPLLVVWRRLQAA